MSRTSMLILVFAIGVAGCESERLPPNDESAVVDLVLMLTTVQDDGAPAAVSGEVCLVGFTEREDEREVCHLVRSDERGLMQLARREGDDGDFGIIPVDDPSYAHEGNVSVHGVPRSRVIYGSDGGMRFFVGIYVSGCCAPEFPAMEAYGLRIAIVEGNEVRQRLELDGEDQAEVFRAHEERSFIGTFRAEIVVN